MVEELNELQDQFALIDLMTANSKGGLLEVLLKKLLPLEFRMEPDNHGAPHIHISYGHEKHTASYRISDGVRIVGDLKNKYDKIVSEWILKNQLKMLDIWIAVQKGDQKSYELIIGQLL